MRIAYRSHMLYTKLFNKVIENHGDYNTVKYHYYIDGFNRLYRLPKGINDYRELLDPDDFVQVLPDLSRRGTI